MYTVDIQIKGTSALLQNKFSTPELEGLMQGSKKATGSTDYSLEWMEKMYAGSDGILFQPASHIEGALVKSAAIFKIKGARGKTWKDPIRAYCYVTPEEIPHMFDGEVVKAPDETLLVKPTDRLRVDIRRAKVKQAAVARSRLMVNEGWQLAFSIEVHDDQVRPEVLREILDEAGRAVGLGDFRPRYGRFEVTQFKVRNGR